MTNIHNHLIDRELDFVIAIASSGNQIVRSSIKALEDKGLKNLYFHRLLVHRLKVEK